MSFDNAKKRLIEHFSSKHFFDKIEEEDPTMVKYIDAFKKIASYGFLSFNSQGGHNKKMQSDNHKNYEMCERSFILGFMEKDNAEKFIKEMNLTTDKICIYIPKCDTDDLPTLLDIPLTIVIKDNDVNIHTHMSTAMPSNVWKHMKSEIFIDNDNDDVVMILCYDGKWNRNGLMNGDIYNNGLFIDVIKTLEWISSK